jgi:hypothetical protein
LRAAGLQELVTESLADYETLILPLCQEPHRLQALRRRIETSVRHSPLFDTAGFTRALEDIYEQMWTRYQRGLPPAEIPSALEAHLAKAGSLRQRRAQGNELMAAQPGADFSASAPATSS